MADKGASELNRIHPPSQTNSHRRNPRPKETSHDWMGTHYERASTMSLPSMVRSNPLVPSSDPSGGLRCIVSDWKGNDSGFGRPARKETRSGFSWTKRPRTEEVAEKGQEKERRRDKKRPTSGEKLGGGWGARGQTRARDSRTHFHHQS